MRKKIVDVVNALSYEDLIDLQRDLFTGGASLKQMVSSRVRELGEALSRICATCGAEINLRESQEYTLFFGPHDFKKRAAFCALDCMEYFFGQLKSMGKEKLQSSKQKI